MKRLLIIIMLCVLISGDTTSQINGSFVFDGFNRTWIAYLPVDFNQNESLPLMLALHGYTQNGQEIMQFSDFNTIADTGRFVVVYPNGIDNSWNVGFAGGSTADDVGFLSALIDTMQDRYNIDLDRVYATGLSNGGFMSYRLACELGNRIAAIAPVAGTMTDGSLTACSPQKMMPVLHIHGTADLIVNYNGGFGNASVDEVLEYWNSYNNCPALPVIEDLPDLVAEGSTVQRQTWGPCDGLTEVMLLKVINGGHTWPGSNGVTGVGNTNRDIVASSEIWNFVSRFSLESPTGIGFSNSTGLRVYPNPATSDVLIVESAHPITSSDLKIYSMDGKIAVNQHVAVGSGKVIADISGLTPGIYFIRVHCAGNNLTARFIVLPR
ncbi:MAG: T9SS type A sorting domain-containing protein [Bacteroidales bacterium]|nr:T9SS type A sorting domain-containing protein [Bacteroidales bacterium]